jgi:hypothetical protein
LAETLYHIVYSSNSHHATSSAITPWHSLSVPKMCQDVPRFGVAMIINNTERAETTENNREQPRTTANNRE